MDQYSCRTRCVASALGERASVQAFQGVRHCEPVQGTNWSRGPFGFPSTVVEPMANAVVCPESLRWGHAEALRSPEGISCLEAGNGPLCTSGAASCGCWPTMVYVGSSGELVSRAGCGGILQTHPTRGAPYARPATLIQASFLLLRLGGWCPPGGTPNVDKALSMFWVANPICCNACMHCAFSSSEGSGIR